MRYPNRLLGSLGEIVNAVEVIVQLRQPIQQTLGQQVSQIVAQIVAGFSQVSEGEFMKMLSRVSQTGSIDHLLARAAQARRRGLRGLSVCGKTAAFQEVCTALYTILVRTMLAHSGLWLNLSDSVSSRRNL